MSEPRDLQFVDTNILVYAHDLTAGEKHVRARNLIRDLWQSGNGCLSIQILQEFYVTVTQKIAMPLETDTAARIVADLSVWQVHCPGVQDVLDAIQLQDRYQLSFWDAMMVSSALQMGCRRIWSEDLNPGQAYGATVVTSPF